MKPLEEIIPKDSFYWQWLKKQEKKDALWNPAKLMVHGYSPSYAALFVITWDIEYARYSGFWRSFLRAFTGKKTLSRREYLDNRLEELIATKTD